MFISNELQGVHQGQNLPDEVDLVLGNMILKIETPNDPSQSTSLIMPPGTLFKSIYLVVYILQQK